jgi:hypothetical protein
LVYVLGGEVFLVFSLVHLHRVGVLRKTDVWVSILLDSIVFFHKAVGEYPELR